MGDVSRNLAVFDFDGTLAKGDSMPGFLIEVGGYTRFAAVAVEALIAATVRTLWPSHVLPQQDWKSLFKERLVLRMLAGRKPAKLGPAIAKQRHKLRWIESTCRTLRDHHAQGHHIVIASGALDLYLPALLEGLPHDAVLCSRVEVADGRITGAMPDGNCVRQRKADLVKAYIETHGPFAESFGYGNTPDDLPMLMLVRHRYII